MCVQLAALIFISFLGPSPLLLKRRGCFAAVAPLRQHLPISLRLPTLLLINAHALSSPSSSTNRASSLGRGCILLLFPQPHHRPSSSVQSATPPSFPTQHPPPTSTYRAAPAAAMVKRGNELGHLSKDEYERETEEVGEIGSGTFRKADVR